MVPFNDLTYKGRNDIEISTQMCLKEAMYCSLLVTLRRKMSYENLTVGITVSYLYSKIVDNINLIWIRCLCHVIRIQMMKISILFM